MEEGFSPFTWEQLITQVCEKLLEGPRQLAKQGVNSRAGEYGSIQRSWEQTYEPDLRAEGRKKSSLKGLERDAISLSY